ncbi:uncharacterized protein LOC143300653 isoform X2 [Babylonia areolata]
MKFWQRQILLSFVLFCFVVVVFLHSRTPANDKNDAGRQARPGNTAFTLHRPSSYNNNNNQLPAGHQQDKDKTLPKGEEDDLNLQQPRQKPDQLPPPSRPPVRYVNQSSGSASECPNLLRPENVAETQQFQNVDGSSSMLEFSAFLDRQERLVRIVGLHVTVQHPTAFCLLWFRPGPGPVPPGNGGPVPAEGEVVKEVVVVPGKMVPLPENHSRRYTAHYIECPLPPASAETSPSYPYAVSVTSNKDCRHPAPTRPSNVMPVIHSYENNNPLSSSSSPSSSSSDGGLKRNFTVCVTALNFRYSRAYELVEMIELNRLLGADLFTFYVNSIGDNVEQILRWYQARGIVQLVDWKLPMAVDHWPPAKQQPEVHYFAQLASHNECLNRHRGVSRYLVYQDLDEFIIPKKTSTWTQLLDSFHDNAAGYLFRCVFFRKEWPPNSENFTGRAEADRYRSIVLSTDKREPNLFPHSHRAKYIVNPMAVQVVGIHNVWRFRLGDGRGAMTHVGESDALLHHYRSWENPNDVSRAVRDTDIYRFKDRLLHSLTRRWSQLPQVPLDVSLSQYGQV